MKVTYEELLKKHNDLTAQLKWVDEELAKCEEKEFIDNLDAAIQALHSALGIYPNIEIPMEVYCNNCDEEIIVDIELADLILELEDFKKVKEGNNK